MALTQDHHHHHTSSSDTASTEVIAEVLHLNDDQFKDLVDRDIRFKDLVERGEAEASATTILPAYSDALRSPPVCDRWYQMLVRLKKSTELTIAAKKSDDKLARIELINRGNHKKADTLRGQFLRWQAGAIRFITGVEVRLTEANYWRRVHFGSSLPSHIVTERDELSVQVRMLRTAIAAHRLEFPSDDDPSDSDETLWALLDDDTLN